MAAESLGLFIAKDIAKQWAGGGGLSEDESFFDRFAFVTGQDVSHAGVMTMEVTYRSIDHFWHDRDSVYIVAERDIYEEYNFGLRFVIKGR